MQNACSQTSRAAQGGVTQVTRQAGKGGIAPEWVSVKQAVAMFGIGRSRFYELMDSGKIRSASIKDKHQKRGSRLIDAQSVRQFLNSMAEGGAR